MEEPLEPTQICASEDRSKKIPSCTKRERTQGESTMRCGALTKRGTKCKIRVKHAHQKCRHHAIREIETCSVCLCPMEPRDDLRRLEGCGHQFHSSCILPWFVRCTGVGDGALTCPLCRHEETSTRTVMWVSEHTEENEEDEWVPDEMWRSVIARVMRNSARRRIRRRLLTSMRTLYDQVVQL